MTSKGRKQKQQMLSSVFLGAQWGAGSGSCPPGNFPFQDMSKVFFCNVLESLSKTALLLLPCFTKAMIQLDQEEELLPSHVSPCNQGSLVYNISVWKMPSLTGVLVSWDLLQVQYLNARSSSQVIRWQEHSYTFSFLYLLFCLWVNFLNVISSMFLY